MATTAAAALGLPRRRHHPTLARVASDIRSGQLHPTDLLQRCFDQIDETENSIHAWVDIDREGAMTEARRLEEEILLGRGASSTNIATTALEGRPLAGIPVGIKDNIDVRGLPTLAGCPPSLFSRNVDDDDDSSTSPAETDAPLVRRLRNAGAIILGKTVTTAYAHLDPSVTRNPWDTNKSPGGSSAGSAAAVSAGMCLVALGTQTGGSIVRPSSYCGVVGLKPTYGRFPVDGVIPVSPNIDTVGLIASCVQDVRFVYEALLDGDAPDASNLSSSLPAFSLDDNERPNDNERPSLKFVLIEDCFASKECDSSVRDTILRALEVIIENGEKTRRTPLPRKLDEIFVHFKNLASADAAHYHRPAYLEHPERYHQLPKLSKFIADGLDVSAMDYLDALQFQHSFREELLSSVFSDERTIAVMPSTTTTATDLSSTGSARFNFCWSFAGFPSITIPGGTSGANGMPCGLQLVGPPDAESFLLEVAGYCEQRLERSS